MAITRAQQAKQMLQDGGMLVKPSTDGKRPGYRQSNIDRGFSAPSKQGQSPRGSKTGGGSNFTAADDRREQESVKQTRTGTVKVGKTGPGGSKDKRQKVSKNVRDQERAKYNLQFIQQGRMPPKTKQGIISNLRNKAYLSGLQKNKVLALRKLGFMDPQAFNIGAAILQGFEDVPDYLKDFTSQELIDIATTGPYLSQQKTKGDVAKFSQGKDLLGRIDKFQDAMAKGTANQKLYDELFPGNVKPRPDDAGRPSDPCLGPNPPSYCFIGKKADETVAAQNAIARNLGGLSPRIAGSIFDFTGMADGGIGDMAREEMFLGGIVKGIKKGLKGATRAIKKVAKSPIGKAALLGAGLGFAGIGPFKGLAGTKLGTGLSSLFQGKTSSILNFVKDNPMLAIGGASLLAGAMTPKEEDEFDVEAYYAANRLNPNPDLFPRILGTQFAADGGRIGYKEGTIESGAMMSEKEMKKLAKSPLYKGFKKMYGIDPSMAKDNPAYDEKFKAFEELFKKGFQEGGDVEPVAKKTMPLLDMGGQEMDLRAEGGFVPIGRMEKAGDVPARLSKNEFVFTAEAVRNAGDGDVDKGAEVMYNMMKNLEDGGNVSDESQGLEGARRMFQTSKRLEEVL